MEVEVVELVDRKDINLFNKLMNRYHKQGMGKGLGRMRYFVGVVRESGVDYWVCGAVVQSPGVFAPVFQHLNIDMSRSYFLRRIARFTPRGIVGDILVDFLNKLTEKLRMEGKEYLVTLGLEDHTNKLYEHAGFKLAGATKQYKKPIYIKALQEKRAQQAQTQTPQTP